MPVLTRLRPLGRAVLNTLLPPQCLGCDSPVEDDGQFCLACFRRVSFVSAPFCPCCGVPLPYGLAGGQGGICGVCQHYPPAFTQARAALRYDDAAKPLILAFKYSDRPEAARGLALLMAKAGAEQLSRAEVLVPVPLHISRLRQRRYNQAALLAWALGRICHKKVLPDALMRTRETRPLSELGFTERRAELANIIKTRHAGVNGKSVLLVDDVMTSGATANECALALRAAGAKRVDVLTAARVPDPRFL